MIVAILQSSIVLCVALCSVTMLRRQSAAVRHAILAAGLVASLVVPALSPLVPSLPVDQLEVYQDPNPGSQTWVFPKSDSYAPTGTRMRNLDVVEIARRIWIGGVVVSFVSVCLGAIRIALLGWSGTSVSHGLPAAAVARRIRLVRCDSAVLGTWGVLRPRILLPASFENWSEERLRIVLTHEIAHIQRLDWVFQMLAELGRAFYWFNPLFWILCRRLRSESEHACDDVVLNAGVDGKDYAAHLLDLARTLKNTGRAWSPAVLAMARQPGLERRFLAMLNPTLNHRSAGRTALFVVCAAAICVMVPVAAMHAREQTALPAGAPAVVVVASAPAAAVPAATSPVAVKKLPVTKPAPVAAVAKPAPAQGLADGGLVGTVYDSTGAAVPGVTVTVSTAVSRPPFEKSLGIREALVQTMVTNEVGAYAFTALPPADYSLRADLPGFATFRKDSLRIVSGEPAKQNIILFVGNLAERVQVVTIGQPRPKAPSAFPQLIRVGGNIRAARLISQVKPVYPQNARDGGIEGTVHIQGMIGTDGTLLALRVVGKTDQDLANAALEAVRQWRYSPTLLNNEPTEVLTDIDVDFKLSQ